MFLFSLLLGYQCDVPKLKEVIDVLRPIQPRWYELFLYLGLKRDTLEKLCIEHPCDDHSSLIEAIINWLQRDDPLPSWEELLEVIQNVVMEGDVAIEIKKKLCYESKSSTEGIVLFRAYWVHKHFCQIYLLKISCNVYTVPVIKKLKYLTASKR